ncbi:MAG: disulfide bond formation protein B [Pseudomonadota bacterium]
MTVYGRILLAATGSALLLMAALAFQYLGGLVPCPLCIWQRWPHLAAVFIGILAVTALWRQRRTLAILGTVAMAASAVLGFYHAGVEYGWWPGPGACTAGDATRLSTDDLMAQIMEAPIVRCDEVSWSFLSVSMAGWNAVVSLGLAALWTGSIVWWRMPFNREV